MAIPFFGKKPTGNASSGTGTHAEKKGSKSRADTTLDFFSQGGDMGRALAAAAGKIQVQEVAVEEASAIEEAAVLYANANEGGARAVLEEALDAPEGAKSEILWRMLFDLFRLTHDYAGFEARGIQFARIFEKSPPVFVDKGGAPEAVAAPRESTPAVNLSGNLSGSARTQFEQLVRVGTKVGKLRLDLSRLRGIDETGCALLNETLGALKQQHVNVKVFGARQAVDLLQPKLKVGEVSGRDFWVLALTLMLYLNDEAQFEDMAVNFAVTFEESPPSWEPMDEATVTDPTGSVVQPKSDALTSVAPPAEDAFPLEGVLSGAQPELLRKLAAYASERDTVRINARDLKRLEFVTAGAFFNQIAQFQAQGKLTIVVEPNEMVGALLRVMGVDQVAQIQYKKF